MLELSGFTDEGTYRRDQGVEGICLGATVCNLETLPSDKYPVPPKQIDLWVIIVISVILTLLLAVMLKYWRSRKKKKALKSSMSEIQKKMEAMKKIDDELLDIDEQVETAKQRQQSLILKRAQLQEKPETWSDCDDILVEVPPDEDQYWQVAARLKETMADAHISKLWRIQNTSLWTYYSFHKDRLSMNKIKHNERSVWHGTSSLDPAIIYNDRQDGFMMQFSQVGLWG
jgi:type II secretory pathway pseudopilin PulG